jgi:hypothetical protein
MSRLKKNNLEKYIFANPLTNGIFARRLSYWFLRAAGKRRVQPKQSGVSLAFRAIQNILNEAKAHLVTTFPIFVPRIAFPLRHSGARTLARSPLCGFAVRFRLGSFAVAKIPIPKLTTHYATPGQRNFQYKHQGQEVTKA